MPAVSVVMPAYNAARYIAVAAKSVLRQTFADLELIIVDDGSSDDTLAVAGTLAAADRRVLALTQATAGPGPARNRAFRAASGRFFAFLDSDDEWDETFLAEQLAFLRERPDIDVVIGNARNKGGRRDGRPSRPVRAHGQLLPLAEILADETCLFIMAVFRREAVEAVGGFDPAFLTNEEYEMWIRVALAGFSFARNPKPLGWYACRPDSLSANDARMLTGILRVLEKTRSALEPRSPERAILERQVERFGAELAATEAQASLARGDGAGAARHLAALRRYRRGNWALVAAERLLECVPAAGIAAFRLRQRLRGAA